MNHTSHKPIGYVLQFSGSIFQFLTDLNTLGTVLLTFSTSHAQGRTGGCLTESSTLHVSSSRHPFVLTVDQIIKTECAGNIHSFRTGHTIAASGSAHLHAVINGIPQGINKLLFFCRKRTGLRL